MSSKLYDILKPLASIYLPALVVLIEGLTEIWNLPYGHAVALTVGVINTFIGSCIQKSSKDYWNNLNPPDINE